MTGQLEQFTIYEHPRDYPNGYVVRRWLIVGGNVQRDPSATYCDTLEEARAQVPEGLVMVTRDPRDSPAVLEVWL